ncbi:farnesol dehydrogenase-like [Euwallacea similis]|uniref:farnesol dehydrogenase-like n=1 Tax=Euwallacea similis TaxID=1736056 RepID=UPI00344ECBC8
MSYFLSLDQYRGKVAVMIGVLSRIDKAIVEELEKIWTDRGRIGKKIGASPKTGPTAHDVAIASRQAIATNTKARNTKGHIVIINNIFENIVINVSGLSIYPTSKFAVTALSKTLRLEINKEKLEIKIINLSPGLVKTEFKTMPDGKDAARLDNILANLKPEDVADATFYVLSIPEYVNVEELSVIAHQMLEKNSNVLN